MKLTESLMTKNPCYVSGRKITVKGLMLHSVGCPQPSAEAFIRSWNRSDYKSACVHAFIDANTGDIFQTLPWDHRGWHAGGAANNTHIGVEMCEPACIRYTGGSHFTCSDLTTARAAAARTYAAAVDLFAMLCGQYRLDPLKDGVILSHQEGHIRRIASNHGDPEHLWQQLKMGYTMDGFRADVQAAMSAGGGVSVKPSEKPDEKKSSYRVKVDISNLNIRRGPGTQFGTNGYTGKGIFTIVEETAGPGSAAGWGKLKSGAGWISLDYAKKI